MPSYTKSLWKSARRVLSHKLRVFYWHRRDVRTRDDDAEDAKTDVRARGASTIIITVQELALDRDRVGRARSGPPALWQQEGVEPDCSAGDEVMDNLPIWPSRSVVMSADFILKPLKFR